MLPIYSIGSATGERLSLTKNDNLTPSTTNSTWSKPSILNDSISPTFATNSRSIAFQFTSGFSVLEIRHIIKSKSSLMR